LNECFDELANRSIRYIRSFFRNV